MKRSLVVPLVALAALAFASSAFAHAHVSPSIVPAEESQVFTLAVPTEKEDATTTKVELTPPDGFSIDSFIPVAGWKRTVDQNGSGEDAEITKVTWDGGSVPTREATGFQFLGRADSSTTYAFGIRQTYSDGSVVDWNGAESSETPAATIEASSSFGGGGGSSTLAIVALVVGAVGVVLGGVALAARAGGRSLT
jgi:uncharacterized protein YcnI